VPDVTLTGAGTPTATFVAPSVATTTTFRFRLTVTEGVSSALTGTTTTDVNVVISNQPPTASLLARATSTRARPSRSTAAARPTRKAHADLRVQPDQRLPAGDDPAAAAWQSVSFPAPALGLGQPGNVQFGLTVTDPATPATRRPAPCSSVT
jgi:hypothetical protein